MHLSLLIWNLSRKPVRKLRLIFALYFWGGMVPADVEGALEPGTPWGSGRGSLVHVGHALHFTKVQGELNLGHAGSREGSLPYSAVRRESIMLTA